MAMTSEEEQPLTDGGRDPLGIIVVDHDPGREFAGIDDQLTKAIEVILEELKTKEKTLPPVPPYPKK